MKTALTIGVLGCAIGAASGKVALKETFDDDSWKDSWVTSNWKGSDNGKWERSSGLWSTDAERDAGLRTTEDFRFYTIGTEFEPVSTVDSDLVVQFSVKHEKREYSFCGGGYVKLAPKGTDLATFNGDTPYSIMFGPDMCGYDVNRVHVIFNHKGENLLREPDIKLDHNVKNAFTHLYTLVLRKDKTYSVLVDLEEVASGSLWDDWKFPQKLIPDPNDKKPADWVDAKKIADPEDKKPDGWDDIPATIPDPDATMPADWDEEDDGEWEAPKIKNPEYKGEWKPKMIDNPDYKGEWKAKEIENPEYDPSIANYPDIGVLDVEVWVVNSGSIFDNFFIGDNLDEAREFAAETFTKTQEGEKDAKKVYDDAIEAAKKSEEEEEDDDDVDEVVRDEL